MTITQKDIEAILGECVGEDMKFKEYHGPVYAYVMGNNNALNGIRSRIPETARKVMEMVRERVICSAVRASDGLVIRGHRHSDAIRTLKQIPGYENEHPHGSDQGFVTSHNRYVDRLEGCLIQKSAGIVSAEERKGRPEAAYLNDELYSEDLYLVGFDDISIASLAGEDEGDNGKKV